MLKSEAKREYQREYMKRKRSNNGSNSEGLTNDGSNNMGLTDYPDIIDKLTDKRWRTNLEYLCSHLEQDEKEVTWLGDYNLSHVCNLLDCTAGCI